MAETQFGAKVKRVRTDNGLEFTSGNMKKFYEEKGILMELTCAYTPQQNRVVLERKHRHILETSRALRFNSGLPIIHFWGECVCANCSTLYH